MSILNRGESPLVTDRLDVVTDKTVFVPLPDFAKEPPVKPTKFQKTARAAGKTAAGLFMLVPPTVGAATALHVAEQPAEVNFPFPGVAAEVSPQFVDYSSITYGPTLHLPAAHKNFLGGKINLGTNLDIKKIDTNDTNVDIQQIGTAVADSPEETLLKPILVAEAKQAGKGLAAGLVAGGFLALAGSKLRRRKKDELKKENDDFQLAKQVDNTPDLTYEIKIKNQAKLKQLEEKKQKRTRRALPKALGAVVLSASLLAGSSAVIYDKTVGHDTPEVSTTPINPWLTEDIPILEGASLSGDVGHYTNQAFLAGLGFMKSIDKQWAGYAESFTQKTLPQFKANGGMSWQYNPDIKAIAHISDVHDNRAFLKAFLPTILSKMDVDVVVNTGDQMSSAGESWLDKGAWARLANTVSPENQNDQKVQVLLSLGNHDVKNAKMARNLTFKTSEGKEYHPLVPLDEVNGYTAMAEGITFVGATDLNHTGMNGTEPSGHEAQMANNAKQGELIADKACEVAETTGEKPIVLAHEQETTYEAIAKGCALLTLSGHLHQTLPVNAYVSENGSITYQNTLGSSSGDGPNNATAIYNLPTTRGAIRIWLYNIETGELVDQYITIYAHPHSPPTIQSNSLPEPVRTIKPSQTNNVEQFLNKYRPGLSFEPYTDGPLDNQLDRVERQLNGTL